MGGYLRPLICLGRSWCRFIISAKPHLAPARRADVPGRLAADLGRGRQRHRFGSWI
jgi:hypothetical protein